MLILVPTVGLTSYDFGQHLARVVLIPAPVVALIARASGSRWAWWRYLLWLLPAIAFFSLLAAAGRSS